MLEKFSAKGAGFGSLLLLLMSVALLSMLRRMTDRVAYKVMLEKLSAKGAGFGSLILLLMSVALLFTVALL